MTQTPPISAEQVEAAACALCKYDGGDPYSLEPGDVPCIDEFTANGDPAHYLWRQYAEEATLALTAAASIPASRGGDTEETWEGAFERLTRDAPEVPDKCDGQLCYYHGCQYLAGCAQGREPKAFPALPVQERAGGNQPETLTERASLGQIVAKGNQPTAYLFEHATNVPELSFHSLTEGDESLGWVQTGLYALSPNLALKAVEAKVERLTEALEIIAGVRPCVDNLMGNVDIARAALGDTP